MLSLLFILFQACSPEAPPKPEWATQDSWEKWNACTDTECRALLIDTVFRIDDPIAAKWINIIEQPEERYLQIERLQTKHPGRIQQMCKELVDENLKHRCLTSAARPHLYAKGNIRPPQSVPKRTAQGPKSSMVLLPLVPNSHLRAVKPYTDQCTDQVDPRSCLHRKAMDMVDAGDSLEVARYCEAIPSKDIRWRWECHFKAAEAFIERDPQNYKIATDHCLVANEYSGRCVTILNKILAKSAPTADSDANAWKQSLSFATEIADIWGKYGKQIDKDILSSFWGFSMLYSYRTSKNITGDPLDHLPAEVIPHIRSAAAYELLSRQNPTTDLSKLVDELEQKLTIRTDRSNQSKNGFVQPTIHDFWMDDKEKDIDVVAVNYLGRSRRTYSDDLREDLSICILEGAARLSDDWMAIVKEHKSSNVKSLKWTARRLIAGRRY